WLIVTFTLVNMLNFFSVAQVLPESEPPAIDVEPDAIFTWIQQGDSMDFSIIISNTGGEDLQWNAELDSITVFNT
ncbi:MAG: hypothetical protein GWN00_32990, partial [Aliifodinibius sp.]|nr:hypothetical protein [Fodinibius sp.]NIY29433.1 hypothetical protein [Fodinibius sp.]